MDGNARWAALRGRKAQFGHEGGVGALKEAVRCCCAWGIKALTVRHSRLPDPMRLMIGRREGAGGLKPVLSCRRYMPFLPRTGDANLTRFSS